MRVSHTGASTSAAFDEPNLVSCAGLAPVMSLATRCGMHDLVADRKSARKPATLVVGQGPLRPECPTYSAPFVV